MASIRLPDKIVLPPTADMHVHLRDGELMKTCTPYVLPGGVDTVYIMPNLTPPITTVSAALSYKSRLQAIEPSITYLMTLYLHPSLTPEIIADAAQAGISGVKAYPAGVTTNSSAGVVDWESFYPIFAAMQEHHLVLNLHGEVPTPKASEAKDDEPTINVLTAESLFLPTLHRIHQSFPKLRIVLEHCTTSSALDAVASCGATVAATITSHHLYLTIDDVVHDADNFCKPVAKSEQDRRALLRAVVGEYDRRLKGRIFFGSDSAPHPEGRKHVGAGEKCAAGCFTQPVATQLIVEALEQGLEDGIIEGKDGVDGVLERLRAFSSEDGRKFYGIEDGVKKGRKQIVLERNAGVRILRSVGGKGGDVVNCFRAGERIRDLRWEDIS